MNEEFDLAVLGGGPGGYLAAIRAAQLGARVALVEKERIGGTCLNRGCIPTKTLLRNVEVWLATRRAKEFGVNIAGEISVDFPRLMARTREVVDTLVNGVIGLLEGHGVRVYAGLGRLVGGSAEGWRLQISPNAGGEAEEITARRVILAVGAVSARPPIPGVNLPGVLTSRHLLALNQQPKSLVVIGASVVGVEFASMFAALGSKVTVLGRRTFLKEAEEQLARRYRPIMARQGITVDVGLEFQEIVPGEAGLRVVYDKGGAPKVAEGEVVLLSAGRVPATDGLGLAELGLTMNGRAIAVNERLETNLPGVYAVGDAIGEPMLASTAYYEGAIAAENALGAQRTADYTAVPNCIFTIPEIAGVGLTEAEAREKGMRFKVSRFPYSALGKALALGETEGQVRMICEEGTGRVLGMHVLGYHASDLIAEGALAVRLGLTAKDIAETIHAHPSLPEATMEAALGFYDATIHYRKVRGD
jgi:dihydrolipoamide dehydrogenase